MLLREAMKQRVLRNSPYAITVVFGVLGSDKTVLSSILDKNGEWDDEEHGAF